MYPTYGSEREMTVWAEPVCTWCCDESDDDQPCSEDCERLAVRAARTRRIVGAVAALQKAERLKLQYQADRIPGDHRIVAVNARIAELDALIGATVAAQVADDRMERERADTMPASAAAEE